jgi:hypothetical protein
VSRGRGWTAIAVAVALGAAVGVARDAAPSVPPPLASPPAPDSTPPFDPAAEAARAIAGGRPRSAIALVLAHLHPDSSQLELRAMLGWALAARDRICLPLPVVAERFRMHEPEPLDCDVAILPAATRDSVVSVFETAERLAPGNPAAGLLMVEFEYRFGTVAGLERALAALSRAASPEVEARLRTLLATVPRPRAAAAGARHLLAALPETLRCADRTGLVTALVRAGDLDRAHAAVRRPAAGACREALVEPWIAGLAAAGRYEELWEYTRASRDPDPEAYYRQALIAALAAAHFDLAKARERLAHEAANAEAYPEQARALLAEFAALVNAEPPAPAARWAALAEHPFIVAPAATNIRFLLHTHALRCEPAREASAAAIAALLEERRFLRDAARRYAVLAAGVARGSVAKREYLRKAAAAWFAAEENGECRAALAELPAREPADELLDGAAALRLGDTAGAAPILERAMAGGGPPAMTWTAKRLLAAARGGAS